MNVSPIYLREVATGKAVAASLCDEIIDEHLEMWDTTWRPAMNAHCQKLPPEAEPQDVEWDWKANSDKWRRVAKYNSFAIVCNGELQGLMLTNNLVPARLTTPVGKPMLYVELLATAPWNRTEIQDPPRYRSTGWMLMLAAIELSREMEYRGRVGLHSLSRSEEFYRVKCEMTDLKMDDKKRMVYFEMTEAQAEAFRQKRKKS
jgi:hypothetical protein